MARKNLTERMVRLELSRLLQNAGKGNGRDLFISERLQDTGRRFIAANPGWDEWDFTQLAAELADVVRDW